MADEQTNYKSKLKTPILTDAGRQVFLAVGNGVGQLVYTRAVLSSQKMVDSSSNQLDNASIAAITSLSDSLKQGQLQITPVVANHFDVIADFDNKDQPDDIYFSTIGLYGRVDSDGSKGTEQLIAIAPTQADRELLAAGSPDHLSTQVISADFVFTISNAANINMTVNEVGYVTRAEINGWQTQVQTKIQKTLDDNSKSMTITLDGKNPIKIDDTHTFNIPTYDKQTIDKMVAGTGKGAGINTISGIAPDAQGNVDLSSKFYLKDDVDNKLEAQQQLIKALQQNNSSKGEQIDQQNIIITGALNKINDLTNRVKFLEENAVLGKRFEANQETDARNWENQHPNYIAFIND